MVGWRGGSYGLDAEGTNELERPRSRASSHRVFFIGSVPKIASSLNSDNILKVKKQISFFLKFEKRSLCNFSLCVGRKLKNLGITEVQCMKFN